MLSFKLTILTALAILELPYLVTGAPAAFCRSTSALCRPFFDVNTADHSIVVSAHSTCWHRHYEERSLKCVLFTESLTWSAHLEVDSSGSSSTWDGITIVDTSSALPGTTGWNITTVNQGNSDAFYLSSLPTPICTGGDGGPLSPHPCPTVVNSTGDQVDQFFIWCSACSSDGTSASTCQFQSANEGQCIAYSSSDPTVRLEDCDSSSTFQLFDILA